MARSTCACTCQWQVILCDPSLARATPEDLSDECTHHKVLYKYHVYFTSQQYLNKLRFCEVFCLRSSTSISLHTMLQQPVLSVRHAVEAACRRRPATTQPRIFGITCRLHISNGRLYTQHTAHIMLHLGCRHRQHHVLSAFYGISVLIVLSGHLLSRTTEAEIC